MQTRTIGGVEYECVSGKYFRDGSHLPLDERPDELIDAIERPFKGLDGIHDVTNSANIVSVYATGWTKDDVREVLVDETTGNYRYEQTVDNRLKKNTPREAEQVIQFRMV